MKKTGIKKVKYQEDRHQEGQVSRRQASRSSSMKKAGIKKVRQQEDRHQEGKTARRQASRRQASRR